MKKTRKIKRAQNTLFSQGPIASTLFSACIILLIIIRIFFQSAEFNSMRRKIVEAIPFEGLAILCLTFISLFLILYIMSIKLSKSNKINDQVKRDSNIRLHDRYALYLRTFFSDNMKLPNPFLLNFRQSNEYLRSLGPEEYLGSVLEPYIGTQQIGRDSSTVGNSRVYISDEFWRDTVKQKITGASIIFILPGLVKDKNTGRLQGISTMWELEYLVNTGRIRHTIAIMPSSNWITFGYVKDAWENARLEAHKFSLSLPKYNLAGAVITFDHNHELWSSDFIAYGGWPSNQRFAKGLINAILYLENKYQFEVFSRESIIT